jgi:hypothetical protein
MNFRGIIFAVSLLLTRAALASGVSSHYGLPQTSLDAAGRAGASAHFGHTGEMTSPAGSGASTRYRNSSGFIPQVSQSDHPALLVTGISPNNGRPAGGTVVTITGSNFASGASVFIGNRVATNVTFVNSTTITAVTPAAAAGPVIVSVILPGIANPSAVFFTYTEEADYIVTTSGNAIVITDQNGNDDELSLEATAANSFRFTGSARTFRVDGGPLLTAATDSIFSGGITGITVNAGSGNDVINVGGLTFPVPDLTINGGPGDDVVNLSGSLNFAPGASLDVDLQNDDITPGADRVTVAAFAHLITASTGSIVIKTSGSIELSGDSRLDAVNGDIIMEANLQSIPASVTLPGIFLSSATLTTSGTGDIALAGMGGTGNFGIDISGIVNLSTAAGTGSITLISDSIHCTPDTTIDAGTNKATLRPLTEGRSIDLGGVDSATALGLTDAELDRITAATLCIGAANSGPVAVSAVISPENYKTLELARDTAFAATGGLALDITSASVFEKVTVNGTVTILPGAGLNVSAGLFVPATGDSFTLLANLGPNPITGTFLAKPEGTTIALNGVDKQLTYLGGTGNDIELIPDMIPPVLRVRDVVITILAELGVAWLDPFVITATDNFDGVIPATCVPDGSTPFPLGVTPVVCTATDSSGNVGTATFNVIVLSEQTSPGERYLDVVSLRGDAATGAGVPSGATIFSINRAFLNNNGGVVFDAALSGAGASNYGLFTGAIAGPVTAIAVKGTPAIGGGAYGAFSNLSLNDAGMPSFQSLNDGATPAQYAGTVLAAKKGGIAPTGGNEEYIVLQKPALASDGSLLVEGNLRLGSGAGVTVNDDTLVARGAAELIAREGSACSLPGTSYGQIHPRVVASEDNGRYAFSAFLVESPFNASNNTAMFSGSLGSGAPLAVVREGDPADGGGGASFSAFLGETVNSAGEIVLRANLGGAGTTVGNNEGLWTNAGNSAAPPVLVAREGDVAPCLPNTLAVFDRFSTFYLGDDGSICFLAFLKDATAVPVVNSGNDGSLWRWKDGQLYLIAREGDEANNTSGSVIQSINGIAYSGGGAVAYDVNLVSGIGDTTTSTNTAVYLDRGESDPAPLLVLRRGDTFDFETINYSVAGIKLSIETNTGGGTGGYGRAINNAGEILLNLTLSNSKSGIFVLGAPPF